MNNILVVEDEIILREGISEELQRCGDFQVDTAADGAEALDKVENEHYDAIIMDIRMPRMDGMELLRRLWEQKNDAIKIIVSGYADFNYAQKAIKFGVSEYIVKPMTPDKIRSIGEKLQELIAARRRAYSRVEQMQGEVDKSRPVMMGMHFSRMIRGEYDGREAERRLAEDGISFPQSASICMVLISPVREVSALAIDRPFFQTSVDTVAVILESSEAAGKFAEDFVREHGGDMICAVGNEQTGEDRLRTAYFSANEALRYAQLMERPGVIRCADLKTSGSNIYLDELEFRVLLATAREKDLIAWVNRVFDELPLEVSRQDYCSLAIYIATLCQSNVSWLSAEKKAIPVTYEQVFRMRTRREILSWVEQIIMLAYQQLGAGNRQRGALEVEKTKTYIDQHLSENISMNDLAQNAYLSPNYLGRIFYEKLGMSISEYINRRRMERACELIRSGDAKIYEIAEQVGVRDPNYFSSLFKKSIGLSPKEYKNLVGTVNDVQTESEP